MALSSRQIIEFLEEVGKNLEKRITIVAAGGTAMTLYKQKPSTIDVDFTGPARDIALFEKAIRLAQPGFKVDTWPNGQVFSQFLPLDYLRKSRRLKRVGRIDLRVLAPVDIVVTKIGRLDGRDYDDIGACIQAFKLTKRAIIRRAKQVGYVGNEAVYKHNLETVTNSFFGK